MLIHARFFATIPPDSPLNLGRPITLRELTQYPLLCNRFGNTKELLESALKKAGFPTDVIALPASAPNRMLINASKKKLGVLLAMPLIPQPEMVTVPVDGLDVWGSVNLVTRADHTLSAAERAFTEFLRQKFTALYEQLEGEDASQSAP